MPWWSWWHSLLDLWLEILRNKEFLLWCLWSYCDLRQKCDWHRSHWEVCWDSGSLLSRWCLTRAWRSHPSLSCAWRTDRKATGIQWSERVHWERYINHEMRRSKFFILPNSEAKTSDEFSWGNIKQGSMIHHDGFASYRSIKWKI